MFALEQQLCSILKTKFIMLNFSKSLLQMNMYKKYIRKISTQKLGQKSVFVVYLLFATHSHIIYCWHTWRTTCTHGAAEKERSCTGSKTRSKTFCAAQKLLCARSSAFSGHFFTQKFHPKVVLGAILLQLL